MEGIPEGTLPVRRAYSGQCHTSLGSLRPGRDAKWLRMRILPDALFLFSSPVSAGTAAGCAFARQCSLWGRIEKEET